LFEQNINFTGHIVDMNRIHRDYSEPRDELQQ
jgi:hypothetical protein